MCFIGSVLWLIQIFVTKPGDILAKSLEEIASKLFYLVVTLFSSTFYSFLFVLWFLFGFSLLKFEVHRKF